MGKKRYENRLTVQNPRSAIYFRRRTQTSGYFRHFEYIQLGRGEIISLFVWFFWGGGQSLNLFTHPSTEVSGWSRRVNAAPRVINRREPNKHEAADGFDLGHVCFVWNRIMKFISTRHGETEKKKTRHYNDTCEKHNKRLRRPGPCSRHRWCAHGRPGKIFKRNFLKKNVTKKKK